MLSFISRKNILHENAPYSWLFKTSKRNFSVVIPQDTLLETTKDISVRVMTKKDLHMVMGWAAQEGWNPGLYEVEPLYNADPTGYRLLLINGVPVASLASVKHSKNFAFLGLFMVRQEYRGKGYGKLLWDISMETLVDCRTIGLNGVINQTNNYAKSGFIPTSLNTRWKGIPSKEFLQKKAKEETKDKIVLSKNHSLTSLINYDAKIFQTPRTTFISQWLSMPQSCVFSAIHEGEIKGYGAVSVSQNGYKIAPLFADNPQIAEQLLVALCQSIGNNNIYVDTNENNSYATILAKELNLTKTFNTVRMYRGEVPQYEEDKIFGLTTLEIG